MTELKKAWQTNFARDGIDPGIQDYELGYIRNHELQIYTNSPENSFVENGELVIRGIKTNDPDCPYTSASLNTKNKVVFKYGKLEMTAKLPYGNGMWPAFWCMGNDIDEVGWPLCGEIDIMELVGGRGDLRDGKGDGEYFSTIHYPNERSECAHGLRKAILSKGNYCDKYHKYGMVWTPETISFYIDDIIWKTYDIKDNEFFHKPNFLLVNLAIGGGWPDAPDDTTVFPQDYRIKSIKYTPLGDIK